MVLSFSGFIEDSLGFMASPKCAISMASSLSVLATRPVAFLLVNGLYEPAHHRTATDKALGGAQGGSQFTR